MIGNQQFKRENFSERKEKLMLQKQFQYLYKKMEGTLIYEIDGVIADFENYNCFIASVGLRLADYIYRIGYFKKWKVFTKIYNCSPDFTYRLWVAKIRKAETKYYQGRCDQLTFIESIVLATKTTINQLNPIKK